ncbi:hypothetical protein JTB14_026363 [Gonioctena quinquepunctata]|nr:hypothetical protein JTB14_026363 [Gonioctena quinquepunctata]
MPEKLLQMLIYHMIVKTDSVTPREYKLVCPAITKMLVVSSQALPISEIPSCKVHMMSDINVSVEEWASMWNEYSKNPDNALEWQTQYLRFMFDLEDASGDGSIDVEEFTSVCSCYGLDPSECKQAFQKMAEGKKDVTYDQFVALWKQFFTSENSSDPGNFIFGKTTF